MKIISFVKDKFSRAKRKLNELITTPQRVEAQEAKESLQDQLKKMNKSQLLKTAIRAEVKRRGLRGLEKKMFKKNFREALKVDFDSSGVPVLVARRELKVHHVPTKTTE